MTAAPFTLEQLEHFKRYVNVQEKGKWNMLDPRAQRATGLTREQYLFVIENYDALSKQSSN